MGAYRRLMNRDVMIARAASALIDAKYHLGSGDGFDCLSMLWHFYGQVGVELPPLPEGFTPENYGEKWSRGEGRVEFFQYLVGIGVEVEPNYAIAGDLMIFDYGEVVASGIYLGSNHVLCAYEKGVLVVPFDRFLKRFLVEVRRCLI